MDWLSELVFKRKSQRSTVFIIETLDNTRIAQFLNLDYDEVFALSNGYNYIIQYNILNGTLSRRHEDYNDGVRTYSWVDIDPDQPPLRYIDKTVRSKPSIVVIHYVYTQDQALQLSNALLEWAIDHENRIYPIHSTVVVFTSSASLFPETVRKFCYTIQVIASTPEERRKKIKDIIDEVIQGYMLKYGDKQAKKLRIRFKEEYVVASAGLDLHMVESATLESIFMEREVKTEYYTKYKIDFLKQYGIEYVKPSYGFEAVGGYNLLKKYVRDRIVKLIKNPKIAEKYSLHPPRGIIMCGLPGVGKSVTGDTVIPISFNKTKWFYIPIRDIEKFISFNRKIGDTELADEPNLYTLALNTRTFKLEPTKIIQFTRHKSPHKLIKLKTRSGRVVKATKDHSFLTLKGSEIIPVKPDELLGKYVPLATWLPSSICDKTVPDADIFGLYVAEGHGHTSSGHTYSVQITTSSPPLKKLIQNSRWKFTLYKRTNKPDVYHLHGIRNVLYFTERCGTNAGNKKIPPEIMNGTLQDKKKFLKAYFSGDGTATLSHTAIKWHRSIEAVTKSWELSEQLLSILLCFGIIARRGVKKRGNTQYYRVGIYRTEDIKKFAEKIGFYQPEKMERVKQISSKFKGSEKVKIIPIDEELYRILRQKITYTRKDMKQRTDAMVIRKAFRRGRITKKLLRRLCKKYGFETILPLTEGEVEWDRVEEIEEYDSNDEYVYDIATEHNNFVLANGIVVHNTFFAKALAKEIGLPLLKIDPSTFLRGIVGETEARVKQITNLIESFAPVIVFIDEIDQIAMARGRVMSTDSGVSRRLTNMLLDWLGDRDRKSIVIGATNFISDLDPAFIRPGRIDEIIPILLPDKEARKEILRIHTTVLRHMPIKDVDFDDLAEKTYGWTGAEIEKLVVEAGFTALSEGTDVMHKHFLTALKTIEVNVEERERRLSEMLSEVNKLENINKAFLNELISQYRSRESRAKLVADQL